MLPRPARCPANRQATLPPAALAARDDVGQREAAQIRLDYLVEALPQPERPAGVRLLTLAAVVYALYRRERALGQAQDLIGGIRLGRTRQTVAAVLAAQRVENARLAQYGKDALEIFF